MDREVIKDTFAIVKALKNNEIDSDFDSQLNLLIAIISKELYSQNIETSKTVKNILEDKLIHKEIKDIKSFYLGKLNGISLIIGQIKKTLDFENFANNLSDDEINSMWILHSRGESVSEIVKVKENEIFLEESSSIMHQLISKKLIISNQFSGYNMSTLSHKGNEVINLLQKKNKKILNNSELSSIYEKEENNTQHNLSAIIDKKTKNLNISKNSYINVGFFEEDEL